MLASSQSILANINYPYINNIILCTRIPESINIIVIYLKFDKNIDYKLVYTLQNDNSYKYSKYI